MLNVRHFPATLGAVSAGLHTFIHAADLFTILCTGLTDFGTDLANTMLKMRVTELKINRGLANLGAIDHESEVICFNMLSTCLKAMVHGSLQADLMAIATSFYTGLHGVFSVSWVIHGILLRKTNKHDLR